MKKERSKIIVDLLMNNINVLQAMQSLSLMLEDIEDKNIKEWVSNEINGYKIDGDIPKYRIIDAMVVGNIQVGFSFYSHVNIPISTKANEMFTKVKVNSPLSTIMQMAKAEDEAPDHTLSMEANLVLVNHYKQTNGEVTHAHRELGLYAYNNIISIIKDKLLEIFKILEKNYGNLDELYIEFSDNKKKKIVLN